MRQQEFEGIEENQKSDVDQFIDLSLWQSEEWFYSLSEYIPGVSIQGYTTDGTVIFWNKASEKIYGYLCEEALGRNLGDLIIPPDIKPHFKRALELSRTVKTSGELMPAGELMLLHKDGSLVPVYSIHTIICHPGKEPVLFCIDVDLSERKKIEAQLTQLTRTLSDKNSHLESIIQIAAHDLRTPMVNVVGFTGELNKALAELESTLCDIEMSDEKRARIKLIMDVYIPESLGFIKMGVGNMDVLLKALLRFAQLGMSATHIEEVDMNILMKDIQDDMVYQIRNSGVDVTIEELPRCFGDRVQLYCIFSNLLTNAIKYRDPARKGKVTIAGKNEGDWVVYCVSDNGIGIEQDNLQNIFNIFYRGNRNGNEGEGIGLTIVKRIIDCHNGQIRVESEVGKGSQFIVSIPASE